MGRTRGLRGADNAGARAAEDRGARPSGRKMGRILGRSQDERGCPPFLVREQRGVNFRFHDFGESPRRLCIGKKKQDHSHPVQAVRFDSTSANQGEGHVTLHGHPCARAWTRHGRQTRQTWSASNWLGRGPGHRLPPGPPILGRLSSNVSTPPSRPNVPVLLGGPDRLLRAGYPGGHSAGVQIGRAASRRSLKPDFAVEGIILNHRKRPGRRRCLPYGNSGAQ